MRSSTSLLLPYRFPFFGNYGQTHIRNRYSLESLLAQACTLKFISSDVEAFIPLVFDTDIHAQPLMEFSVCFISIIRLVVLSRLHEFDVTWNYVNAAIWSAAEPCVRTYRSHSLHSCTVCGVSNPRFGAIGSGGVSL